MGLILAVDGGATKTAVSVRDEKGSVLLESGTKGTNYHVISEEEFKNRLSEALFRMKGQSVDVGVFALAGIDTEEDQRNVNSLVQEVLAKLQIKVGKLFVENDGYSTLLGLTLNNPGVLTISGTGSIAFAHAGNGVVVRSGGWGHRAGDEGSGYYIGREIIRAVIRMNDGRGPETVLKEMLFKHFRFSSVDELTQWLYSDNYSVDRVAGLSSILEAAFQEGDAVAEKILSDTVHEIANLIYAVLRSAKLMDVHCPVYLNGGTVRNNAELFARIKSQIELNQPGKVVKLCTESPIEYIYSRALKELKK